MFKNHKKLIDEIRTLKNAVDFYQDVIAQQDRDINQYNDTLTFVTQRYGVLLDTLKKQDAEIEKKQQEEKNDHAYIGLLKKKIEFLAARCEAKDARIEALEAAIRFLPGVDPDRISLLCSICVKANPDCPHILEMISARSDRPTCWQFDEARFSKGGGE